MDRIRKSVIKAFTWRIFSTIFTMIIVSIFIGNIGIVLSIGFLDLTLKLILYYVHERIWNSISWGKRPMEL